MLEEFLKHRWAYLLLIIELAIFVALFLWVWPNREATQVLIGFLMLFYFAWGCIVHTKTRTLTVPVVLEYAGASLLAGVCLHVLLL